MESPLLRQNKGRDRETPKLTLGIREFHQSFFKNQLNA